MKITMVMMMMLGTMACGTTTSTTDDDNSSSETCNSEHECINDVCECKTSGKDGNSCTDNSACVSECEVCS